VHVATQEVFREAPTLTKLAFNRLLEWLDDGVDSHGQTYLEMRRRLVSYFDRRNRPSADELADETLNRIGRTLEKTGAIAITPPARYCFVVARFVLLEDFRGQYRHAQFDEERGEASSKHGDLIDGPEDGLAAQEQRLECLDLCLKKLKPEQRDLIVEYYRDARRKKIERRRDLAKRLGISMNALGIRACRIRDALEVCVASRLKSDRRCGGVPSFRDDRSGQDETCRC
jgi:DNA-directed RNA polymerase specialized sigma24 family protein